MERVPGANLEWFWLFPREERGQIRAAFKRAWQGVVRLSEMLSVPRYMTVKARLETGTMKSTQLRDCFDCGIVHAA